MDVSRYDCLVLGAGPAGLAAAVAAAQCGLEVALIDEQEKPGGQLFRRIQEPDAQGFFDASEYQQGLTLLEQFAALPIAYFPKTTVWSIDETTVSVTRADGTAEKLHAGKIIVAPGGMERPVPFVGWTLPGVMGAGALDIMLRSGITPQVSKEKPVIICGNGPLLLALVCHLIEHNVPIGAWLDTGALTSRLQAVVRMPLAFLDIPYLKRGLTMAKTILQSKIPLIRNVTAIEAHGENFVEAISYRNQAGKEEMLPAGLLVRHEGIVPRTQIANALGLDLEWNTKQRYWHPKVSVHGCTSHPDYYIAGDAAFVDGGIASMHKGTLAGLEVARALQVIDAGEAAFRGQNAKKELERLHKAHAYLQDIFAPHPDLYNVPDETIVCRCESVQAGMIRAAVKDGAQGVNEIKRFTRCGMGPCQGRMCGFALAEIAAKASQKSVPELGQLHMRMPFRPVSLEQYCAVNGFKD